MILLSYRFDISFKTIAGEAKSVTSEMTAPWLETTLPTILSRYPIENIFNADEFGLFYQCSPNKTFHFKKEKCTGGKHSKVRLTGMAAGNAKGERLPMFVIGKSKNPRCFKGIKSFPCRYRSQPKSWMCSELFEEWVRELDRSFGSKKRKIALIVDNCPAHPAIDGLKWIEVVFLPPNTTSMTQPMDQGVIRALKAKYRSSAVKRLLYCLEKRKKMPKFSILTAMTMLNNAWNSIPDRIFLNCFKKSGISVESVEKALNDDDDPFASLDIEEDVIEDLQSDLEIMRGKFNIEVDVNATDLVDIDSEVCVSDALSDADIIDGIMGHDYESENDDDDDNEQPVETLTKPDIKDVMNALSLLEDYSLFSTFGADIRKHVGEASRLVCLDTLARKKQCKIKNYFT